MNPSDMIFVAVLCGVFVAIVYRGYKREQEANLREAKLRQEIATANLEIRTLEKKRAELEARLGQ